MTDQTSPSSRRPLVSIAAVVGLGIAVLILRKKDVAPRPPEPMVEAEADAGTIIPAQEEAEDGLRLAMKVERQPKARKLELELGGGVALLVLEDAKETEASVPLAFGHGTLGAADREKGAAFVAAVAGWLETPVPPPAPNPVPLEPVKINYVRLGAAEGDKPETLKLFLQAGRLEAEIFLNLFANGVRASFVEKDEEYRKDVIAFLAMALRDGPSPPRSTKTDPNLATDEPLITRLVPIAGKGSRHAFLADGTLIGSSESSILRWSDPRKEPALAASFDAEVFAVTPAPQGSLVAVTLTRPETKGVHSGDDPQWIVLWDSASGTKAELVRDEDNPFTVLWSSDGKHLAVDTYPGSATPRKGIVRVFEVQGRHAIGATEASLDVTARRWVGAQLLLHSDDYSGGDSREKHYLWSPGPAMPKSTSSLPAFSSPDGSVSIAVDGDALAVTPAGGTPRYFKGSTADDRETIRGLGGSEPIYVGPRGLAFHAEELYVLDLDSLKLQRATGCEPCSVERTSADARQLVFSGGEGQALYARVK